MSHITCINEGCRNMAHHKGDPCDFCRVAKYINRSEISSAALNKCGSDGVQPSNICAHCGDLIVKDEQQGWLHEVTQLACCGGVYKTFATPTDEPIIPDPLLGDASLTPSSVTNKCLVCSNPIIPINSSGSTIWTHEGGEARFAHMAVPFARGIEEVEARQNEKINKQIWENDVRLEEQAIIDAGGEMTRNDLFLISQQMCNESLTLMRQRNVEYAPESDPLANLRAFRMVSVCQEIHNCYSRLKRYALADLRGEDKPMTEEQVRNAENDLHNFSLLFRAMRIQCAGGKR